MSGVATAEVATAEAPTQAVPAITRVEWAPVPRVNLLPAEIFQVRRFKRVQRLLALAVLGAVGVALAGFWWSEEEVRAAEERLAVTQSRTATLQRQQRAYAEVPKTIEQVQFARKARARVMATDVLWHQYLAELTAAAPAGVTFDAITAKVSSQGADGGAAQGAAPPTAAPAAPSQDPLSTPGIGNLTIDGVAGSYPNVAAWLEAVDKVNGLDSSSLSKANLDDSEVTYASAVVITPKALSHRYDEKAR